MLIFIFNLVCPLLIKRQNQHQIPGLPKMFLLQSIHQEAQPSIDCGLKKGVRARLKLNFQLYFLARFIHFP